MDTILVSIALAAAFAVLLLIAIVFWAGRND